MALVCPDMRVNSTFFCINYDHCNHYIHSYKEVLSKWSLNYDTKKVLLERRSGQKIFKNLNWNITLHILEYLPYKTIMNKVRFINHETIYITNERMAECKIKDKAVRIHNYMSNFVPLLTHPVVKFAEEISIVMRDDCQHLDYHLINLFNSTKYFTHLKSFNFCLYEDRTLP